MTEHAIIQSCHVYRNQISDEAREVVGGSPTDILYVWAWSLFFN